MQESEWVQLLEEIEGNTRKGNEKKDNWTRKEMEENKGKKNKQWKIKKM